MTRPAALVVVTGTGTEVGKTWWAAALITHLRTVGRAVAARKPAQSFAPGDERTDADVLAAASGETPHRVCPAHRWYAAPLAPPMAAEALGRPTFTTAELVAETTWPDTEAVGVVEGAGGVRSPLTVDGDTVTLARALAADLVVLVAEAGLGTINAVRLATAALSGLEVIVALNRYDPDDELHRANRAWLTDRDDLSVVTVPTALDSHL